LRKRGEVSHAPHLALRWRFHHGELIISSAWLFPFPAIFPPSILPSHTHLIGLASPISPVVSPSQEASPGSEQITFQRGARLDEEASKGGGSTVVRSVRAMCKRVKKCEGWGGLHKGER
jgi:hypothetical protein